MKRIVTFLLIFFISFSFSGVIKAVSQSSYILLDADSGRILYSSNENSRFLTASICKIMTAMVAIENGDLFKSYKVSSTAIKAEGSSIYLQANDEICLIDLLYGLLLRSGNDAAILISEVVFGNQERFIIEMNNLAKKIGMTNSTFENPTGLDATNYNYSTALDMAKLMRYAVSNEVFLEICGKRNYRATTKNNTYYWYNKHRLLQSKDYVKAGKTGYTKRSGRTLVSYAEINNLRLVAVTFNMGNDFSFHNTMFLNACNDFESKDVLKSMVFPQEIDDLSYYPFVDKEVRLLVRKNAKLKIIFYLKKYPKEKCGYLELYENNKAIYRQDLYTYRPKR